MSAGKWQLARQTPVRRLKADICILGRPSSGDLHNKGTSDDTPSESDRKLMVRSALAGATPLVQASTTSPTRILLSAPEQFPRVLGVSAYAPELSVAGEGSDVRGTLAI